VWKSGSWTAAQVPVLPVLVVDDEDGHDDELFWKHCEVSQHQMLPEGAELQVFWQSASMLQVGVQPFVEVLPPVPPALEVELLPLPPVPPALEVELLPLPAPAPLLEVDPDADPPPVPLPDDADVELLVVSVTPAPVPSVPLSTLPAQATKTAPLAKATKNEATIVSSEGFTKRGYETPPSKSNGAGRAHEVVKSGVVRTRAARRHRGAAHTTGGDPPWTPISADPECSGLQR
jgi:hypothetical protein